MAVTVPHLGQMQDRIWAKCRTKTGKSTVALPISTLHTGHTHHEHNTLKMMVTESACPTCRNSPTTRAEAGKRAAGLSDKLNQHNNALPATPASRQTHLPRNMHTSTQAGQPQAAPAPSRHASLSYFVTALPGPGKASAICMLVLHMSGQTHHVDGALTHDYSS